MQILPLKKRLVEYLSERGIAKLFEKQKQLFERDPFHHSLHTELLNPKHLRIYSFRITRGYRAIFVYKGNAAIDIVDINNHYQ